MTDTPKRPNPTASELQSAFDRGMGSRGVSHHRENPFSPTSQELLHQAWDCGWNAENSRLCGAIRAERSNLDADVERLRAALTELVSEASAVPTYAISSGSLLKQALRNAYEVLATPTRAENAQVRGETGWLIETGDGGQLLFRMATRWTSDHAEALRFARREDAQAFADAFLSDHRSGIAAPQYTRIAEHAWN